MEKTGNIIDMIVEKEWDMFHNTQNTGGQAACQNDRETFEIMRKSQWMACNNDILKSYLDDLSKAESSGRNLITEKYAWMMESTFPEEFEDLKEMLPEIDPEKSGIVEKMIPAYLRWREEVDEKYPKISGTGRPLKSSEDSKLVTSVETYFRGELLTYSLKTLKLYYDYILECEEKGINLANKTLENTAGFYGYSSLEDAEKKQRNAKGDE